MADALQTTFRLLVVEDFGGPSAIYAPTVAGQTMTTVLNVGSIPLTPFVAAPNDSGAAAAGVVIGQIYINTGSGTIYLAARLT